MATSKKPDLDYTTIQSPHRMLSTRLKPHDEMKIGKPTKKTCKRRLQRPLVNLSQEQRNPAVPGFAFSRLLGGQPKLPLARSVLQADLEAEAELVRPRAPVFTDALKAT